MLGLLMLLLVLMVLLLSDLQPVCHGRVRLWVAIDLLGGVYAAAEGVCITQDDEACFCCSSWFCLFGTCCTHWHVQLNNIFFSPHAALVMYTTLAVSNQRSVCSETEADVRTKEER